VRGYFDARDFAEHKPSLKKLLRKQAGQVDGFPPSILDTAEPMKKAPLLATHWVNCVGEAIGIVVADTLELARRAAELVEVTYAEEPAIFTIEEAIEKDSFYNYGKGIVEGDVDGALAGAAHVVEGDLTMNGQEHWYTEPHALTVIPGEDEEMTVVTCTQCVMKTQNSVAGVLGVPACKVVVKVKRIGGAFGGKEVLTVAMAAAAAVAARELNRPVRMLLTRKQDMSISGQRHPFLFRYKAGFSAEGRLVALDASLYNNGGHSISVTREVMDRALFHSINSYTVDNLRVKGYCCRTNLPNFTAYRGFGATQVKARWVRACPLLWATV
jgi:xanthine dehydrogenase/oxidase